MDAAKNFLINTYRHFMHDSLYRNSIFLMLDTAILAIFGFVFWAIAARKYSVHDVGVTATLISAAGLITLVSALGFDSTIIRYLANSKSPKKLIDTAITITGAASIIGACIYLLIVNTSTNNLSFMHGSPLYFAIFVGFMVINLLNNISNNIFIAHRKMQYVMIINLGFSILRLIMLLLLVGLGLNGLLVSHIVGVLASLILTLFVLRVVFNYSYLPIKDLSDFRKYRSYLLRSYISNTLFNVTTLLLPTVLLLTVGPKFAAYYFIVSTLVSSLNILPYATAQSLFAEGSMADSNLKQYFIKSSKLVAYTLIPCLCILAFAGTYILSIFGHVYAENGTTLLYIIAISMLPRAANYLLSTVFKIRHKLDHLIKIYTMYSMITIVGSYIVTSLNHSLIGLGIIILVAESVTTMFLLTVVSKTQMLTLNNK